MPETVGGVPERINDRRGCVAHVSRPFAPAVRRRRPTVTRMTTRAALRASTALATAALCCVAAPAAAAPTPPAELVCDSGTYTVTGFGRGQVLHVVGSTARFVPTHVELTDSGRVVFDAPGQADRATDTCTATSPLPGGRTFSFTGFFTPQG